MAMDKDLDCGFWSNLELYIRSLIVDFHHVISTTIAIYRPTQDIDGTWVHHHPIFGTPERATCKPNFYAKLILVVGRRRAEQEIRAVSARQRGLLERDQPRAFPEKEDEAEANFWAIGAFVVPNACVELHKPMRNYYRTLEQLEGLQGAIFPDAWKDPRANLRTFLNMDAFVPLRSNVPAANRDVVPPRAEGSSAPARRQAAAAAAAQEAASRQAADAEEGSSAPGRNNGDAPAEGTEQESEKKRGKRRARD